MEIISTKIEQYVEDCSNDEPQLLKELNRETWQKVLNPLMISGAYQGRLLSMISKIKQSETILEIGTYTGYSALCLAEGLIQNGVLHTIDINEELLSIQSNYFQKSPFSHQIKQHIGNALEIIPTLDFKFDLVFIDADKINYANYFHAIINKMNKGGIILSDNVLWKGKVVEPIATNDFDTTALVAYNKLLKEDPRIETVLLPVRDGLTISRVK
ncbi:MAG: class I SAM-dependent methyltransferase [Flavobacteriaceae bacterium]|nr:class I SAM-dependent methyltransferase [Flavobacteriaceae bacterium]